MAGQPTSRPDGTGLARVAPHESPTAGWLRASPEALRHAVAGGARCGVDVWLCPIGPQGLKAPDFSLLDEDEQRRAGAFRSATHRDAFVASHVALRRILAARLNAQPRDLRFEHGRWRKPRLAAPFGELQFNLSHSGGWALVALTEACPLGVDVECLTAEPPYDIAPQVFSPGEMALLRDVDHASGRAALFYALWCRKEALAKGLGVGFGEDARMLDVSGGIETPQARAGVPVRPGGEREWYVRALPAIPGAASALAVARPDLSLRTFLLEGG